MFIMYKLRTLTLFLMGLFIVSNAFSQSPADSMDSAQVNFLKNLADAHAQKSDFFKALGEWWILISFVAGGLLTFFGVRAWIDRLVDDMMTKKASEKLGVDWGTVKMLVDERKALLAKRSKVKVAIINQKTGKKDTFHDLLTKAGYPEPGFFILETPSDNTKEAFGSAFKQADFHFLIVDNEDEAMSDSDIKEQVIDNQIIAFSGKIIWYTKREISREDFAKYSKQATILKNWSNILSAIDEKI